MIPYSPEELMAIAEKEYAFSLSEAKKAAREMGLGSSRYARLYDDYSVPTPLSRSLIYGDGILSCLEVCSSGFGLLSP